MTQQTVQDTATDSTKYSSSTSDYDASRPKSSSSATGATELARAKSSLRTGLRQYPDFPIPGIDFVDIMPLFATPHLHSSLVRACELQVLETFATANQRPEIIVGLDARGFLFGPSLALRLGAGFVPVRKRGKLPGPVIEASYTKEYGIDHFQIQKDAIKKGQSVLIVDDIIATGGSAYAAGQLVEELAGKLLGYLFILDIPFLKGSEKLNAPTITLLSHN